MTRLIPALIIAVLACCASAAQAAPVTVSLEWDDGLQDQYGARQMLADHGMHGTFYINSGRIGRTGFMAQTEIEGLRDDGNEIGGHTITHVDLPTLSPDEQRRQVCNDRSALLDDGFRITDFAYPFGSYDAGVEQVVAGCGYNSARQAGGIVSPGACGGCNYAETSPPQDIWATRIPDSVKVDTPLDQVIGYITNARDNGGGWVQILMHHICDGCNPYSITQANLQALLDWIAQQRDAGWLSVKTVNDVIGGPVQPAVRIPDPPPATGANVLFNPGLEDDTNNDGLADCWQKGGTGTNNATWSRITRSSAPLNFAMRIDMTSFTDGDRKLVSKQDTGTCAPTGRVGHTYTVQAWYRSGTSQPRLVAYYRTKTGAWTYWAQSPVLPASTTWRQATWTTPAMPADGVQLSVGLSLRNVGFLEMDDFLLGDSDQTPPLVNITSPLEGTRIHGTAAITADAGDNAGIDHVDFLVNGAVVGTDRTAPYSTSWDTTQAVDQSSVSISARATDTAGNTTLAASQMVTIDNADTVPPTSSIACDGGDCSGWANHPVQVALSATDDNSGVGSIVYTTDGSDPRHANGTVYTGPFTISSTTTVNYRAYDKAGNRELYHSANVQIETDPPTSSITCNGGPCSSTPYSGAVNVALAATDSGGSGLDRIVYTTDGSDPSSSNGQVYSGTFSVSSRTNVRYRAIDKAGNAEAIKSQTIDTDGVPPTTTATCNGGDCSQWFGGSVSVTLSATDSGDSGVASIVYTTDGSDPDLTNGTVYGDAFAVPSSATVKYRAYDAAGNAEPVETTQVRIDTLAPSATITCNGTPCAAWYKGPVTVGLAGSDAESGLQSLRYTTDLSDPTLFSGQDYSGTPFTIGATTTVRYRAYDLVGNASPIAAQSIGIDTTAPTAAVASPAAGATVTGTTYIVASVSDNVGIARVRFYLDGTQLGTRTVTPYQWKWDTTTVTKGRHTLAVQSEDLAGNATRSASITVTVA